MLLFIVCCMFDGCGVGSGIGNWGGGGILFYSVMEVWVVGSGCGVDMVMILKLLLSCMFGIGLVISMV